MDVAELGPVEFLVVRFPGSRFRGEIAPALADLVDAGTVRILDLVFITKSEDGDVDVLELVELDDTEAAAFRALGYADDEDDVALSDEDLMLAAEGLAPGDSAAVLVWEDVWAAKFAAALRRADAEIVALERIPRDVVVAAATGEDES
ncbi:MAG TPA: DUF6325 family protein [Acidimicrobiales bacterium]|nr:DUF6325 family protein [Acidimicrobiales bacterium]